MTHSDILELLSKSIDETLSESETIRLAQAMRLDPTLQKLKDELNANKAMCLAHIAEAPELVQTEMLAKTFEFSTTSQFSMRHWMRWLIPLAAAATMIWFIMPHKVPNQAGNETNLMVQLNNAQQAYSQAIHALETRAYQHLDQLPPHLQATFRENLKIIDQAIANCEKIALENETQLYVYKSLAKAYEAKNRLLKQIIKA